MGNQGKAANYANRGEAVLKGEVREGMKFKNAILMSLYFS